MTGSVMAGVDTEEKLEREDKKSFLYLAFFLATLIALHFTPEIEWVGRSFELA